MNALRHGLSVPLDPSLFEKEMSQITAILGAEGLSQAQAQELARRILEYERNESLQRTFLEDQEDPTRWSQEQLLEFTREDFPEFDMISEMLEIDEAMGVKDAKVTAQARRLQGRLMTDALKRASRAYDRRQSERERSLRYLRRAANQLAKGIKAASVED